MKKMSILSRLIIAVASLSLTITFFVPVWFIFLLAPQYPEGLTMKIWLTRLTGDVDIINGLNHYIGMKHISQAMFPEFDFLLYILGFFVLFGLVIAITGKRKLLFSFLLLSLAGGVAALIDFYQWGYDYGHHLDPKAAIQVPGLYYQPPLIGHKTLLNFDAYSYPDTGGWIIVGAVSLMALVWWFEFRKSRKAGNATASFNGQKMIPAVSLIFFMLHSCSVKPEPFQYGKDVCDDCQMTIVEPQFGGEIITKKGRVFKFDDVRCLVRYLHSGKLRDNEIAQTVFVDYNNAQQLLDVHAAAFVSSPQLKSPMNGNVAAFADAEKARKVAGETGGTVQTWDNLQSTIH